MKMLKELHTNRRSAKVWPSVGKQTAEQAVSCTAKSKRNDKRLVVWWWTSGQAAYRQLLTLGEVGGGEGAGASGALELGHGPLATRPFARPS